MSLRLVIGGIRSGKSRFAEQMALKEGAPPWIYLPTAFPSDPEMKARIEKHRQERDERWDLFPLTDTPEASDAFLERIMGLPSGATLLLDGMGLFLGQVFWGQEGTSAPKPLEIFIPFCDWLSSRKGLTIVVSDEVGFGGVPMTRAGRQFADALGETNQRLAEKAMSVYLMVAGFPLTVK
ncbi:bifunctional adenosylcobinamide kinase/adenosylcobinamide-phosphate guanylyltransferase [Leptospirillum ferriphilum]|uniref:Adenosylcobinamide kinase n=2 Tax=Leptospirillum TaxID=179 RepID=A0A094X578_9BACT|nr:bifunctional adenosylcobinamide kinase/adenosylcobinamide-phosphate guanylyltransferase [Leptospirillum ferriphilum]EDZ38999.1 MAG: Putative cobalbumin biosynthesis enzyme [Leptospirillum sp. Group II '5-way CG']KGA93719.1 Adenosylcobinamide-phosphate guanylyltransferase [Leptospirillum ferriphilum]